MSPLESEEELFVREPSLNEEMLMRDPSLTMESSPEPSPSSSMVDLGKLLVMATAAMVLVIR
jgi:hypothetical protein